MFEFVFSARLLAQSCFLRGYFSCMRVEDNTQHLFSLAGSRRKLLKDLMKYDLCGKREVKISIFGDISHMYGYICMYVYCTMVLYLYVVEKHTKKHMYVHVQVEIFTYRYLGGVSCFIFVLMPMYVMLCMYVIVLYCRMYGVLYGLHTSYLVVLSLLFITPFWPLKNELNYATSVLYG